MPGGRIVLICGGQIVLMRRMRSIAARMRSVLVAVQAEQARPAFHDLCEQGRVISESSKRLMTAHPPPRRSPLATHGRTSAARLAAIPAGESPANRGVQTLL
jgi:hypothetical protein